jgi:hypothetical protein
MHLRTDAITPVVRTLTAAQNGRFDALLLSSKGCKLIALRAPGPSSDHAGTGLIAEEDRY